MKKKNDTKRSLRTSGVSLLLCLAMLVGTTFAWFTDSISNKGNIIQSGNLDIGAFVYDVDADGDKSVTIPGVNNDQEFKFEAEGQNLERKTSKIINEKNWEPGISNAKLLEVSNNGSLATKIKLNFSVNDGGLQKALWFDFVMIDKDGNVQGQFTKRPMSELTTLADSLELSLSPEEMLRFVLVYGMYEEAGNEYQGKSFSADVAIVARQDTHEVDGFGNNQYDASSEYPWDGFSKEEVEPNDEGNYDIASPANLAWLSDELTSGTTDFKGKTITLHDDIDMNNQPWKPIVLGSNDVGITIDGNGKTIKNLVVDDVANAENGVSAGYGGGFIRQATGKVTIKDLKFDNVKIAPGKDYSTSKVCNVVGIVMGYAYSDTVFENVEVTNSTVEGFGKVGVLLGMGADPGIKVTFKNCVSKNNTIKAGYNAGGLAGNIQRKNGIDNTVIENCTVEGNKFVPYPNNKYVNLENVPVTYKSNDLSSGQDVTRNITGTFWIDGTYYWGAYGKYYVSYGSSSYDPVITAEGAHKGKQIANSEICINSLNDIPK